MNHLKKKLSAKVITTEDDADADLDDDLIGEGLTEDQLRSLVSGFKGSILYPSVAQPPPRCRNDLLAQRWTDVDFEGKTIRVERALKRARKKFGIRIKPPKTARGKRKIDLDVGTVSMLVAERERHQRIHAGIPDGAEVNLGLIRLPFRPHSLRARLRAPAGHRRRHHAIEVYNPRVAIGSFNEEAARFAAKYRIPAGAGSDAHVAPGLGTVRVRMPDSDGPEEFLEALRQAEIITEPATCSTYRR